MLFEETQGFLGIKTAGAVLDEHRGTHTPGAEEITVRRFGPAGIGEVPMQVPRLQIEPVLARDEVRQRIGGMRMQDHFGTASGAGGEIDDGGIGAAGQRWRERLARRGHRRVIRHPPWPGAAQDDKVPQGGAIGPHGLHLGSIGLIDNDHVRLSHIDAILKVLWRQENGAWHGDSP